MAITKIHAIKSTLGKALAYIENPDKTDGQMLVSGYNCEPQTASIDFEMTAVLEHKARNLKRKRSASVRPSSFCLSQKLFSLKSKDFPPVYTESLNRNKTLQVPVSATEDSTTL